MKRIEVIIPPTSGGRVCTALEQAGHPNPRLSIFSEGNCGSAGYLLRGTTYKVDLGTRSKVEFIAEDGEVDRLLQVIRDAAASGDCTDVEILVYAMEEAIHIGRGGCCTAALS